MITIQPSPTADTRTCDVTQVSKEQLLESSRQHIEDVRQGLEFFVALLNAEADCHDYDKITDINSFYADFQTKFERTDWYTRHKQLNRHHLNAVDGIPIDVNLVDVIAYITDCVMAGLARSGQVYALEMDPLLLLRAFTNTVNLLKSRVTVATPVLES